MTIKIKWPLKHLYTSPHSPNGRKMRIEHLLEHGQISKNDATYIVYIRDYERGYQLTQEEINNWQSFDSRCPYQVRSSP